MIHYTLLPDEEIKSLRNEYRIRFIIIAAFFISCGIVLGVISLIPAYVYSHTQAEQVLMKTEEQEKSRKANGVDQMEKDLAESQRSAGKIKANTEKVAYEEDIERIVSYRPSQVLLNSFAISHGSGTSTPYEMVIQGKALTREALLEFQKGLVADASFVKVDLPLSDLAKSKDIAFTLTLTLLK